jgi:hypothetical protein
LASVVLVGLLSAIGCQAPTSVDISGTVTLDGAPVSGTVYFWYPSYDDTVPAVVVSAPLDAQGNYSIKLNNNMQYPIALTNPQAPLPGPLPDPYADPVYSRLKVTIPEIGGPHTLDIQIFIQDQYSNQIILK